MRIRVRSVGQRFGGTAALAPRVEEDVAAALEAEAAELGSLDADVFLGESDEDVRTWVHTDGGEDDRRLAGLLHGAVCRALGAPDGGIWAHEVDLLQPPSARCRLDLPAHAADLEPVVHALADGLLRWVREAPTPLPYPEARLLRGGLSTQALEPPGLEDARAITNRRVARTEGVDIWHEVPLVPQITGMSCWAAAAAMIVGWRECIPVNPEEVAGPLWLGEADPGLHVIVIAGLYGDGTPEGTSIRVADPWPVGRGERYTVPWVELQQNIAAVSTLTGTDARLLRSVTKGGSSRIQRRSSLTLRH